MILRVVKGYEIPFILPPRESRLPSLGHLTKEASGLVDQEVQDMLMKGTIVVLGYKEDQFLSQLFLAKKRDGGNSPAANLKDLNSNISYQHLKIEGFFFC